MEGLPVVLMEAMAAGLVAVSTNVAGVPELVEDGRTGFLVRGGSSEALRDVLMRVAREIDWLDAMRAAAREKVVAEFDVARSCEQLRSLFERYLGGERMGGRFGGELAGRAVSK
jgi:glycosyltransferase involved in cell wall biosynthesis